MLKEIFNSDRIRSLEDLFRQQDSILIEHLWNAPKALVASLAQLATGKHVLILTGASQEEVRLYQDFAFFTDRPVIDFPAWEALPSENIAPSPDIVGERYRVLHELTASKEPVIILSGLQACLQKLIPPTDFSNLYLSIEKGITFPFDQLIQQLVKMGYQRTPVAADKGEFAVRGGIIDIFPVSSPDPFRIEFWGDEIESLRIYDPIGQKSVKPVDSIQITPAQELELHKTQSKLCTILDYLGPNTIVVFDDLLSLEDRYASLISICGTPTGSFSSIEQFLDQTMPLQKLFWAQSPIEEMSDIIVHHRKSVNYYSQQAEAIDISFEMFNRQFEVKRWQSPFATISNYLFNTNIYERVLLKGLEGRCA